MKILYVVPYFYPVKGGAENHVYYLAKELVKKGHDITVLTSDLDRNTKISKSYEVIEGIKIKRLKTYFKIGNFVSFFPSVFTEFKKIDFDILHIHGYRHPHNFIIFFTKKPKVITTHWPEYPKEVRGTILSATASLFDTFLGKLILNKFNIICAVNKLEVDWYKKFKINKNKIKITPNGIPKEYLKLRNKNTFRKKLKIKENKVVVSSLARLHKSKGLDLLINAAKDFPEVQFIIAGSKAGYEQTLKNLILKNNLKNVMLIENLEEKDKLDFLRSSDIFVHPSYYDAFGISILEAYSQKNAVIASNAGGIPWVIENAGLLFKTGSLKDLKFKLNILINDKKYRQKLSNKGYDKAKKFIWENIAKDLEVLYKKLL